MTPIYSWDWVRASSTNRYINNDISFLYSFPFFFYLCLKIFKVFIFYLLIFLKYLFLVLFFLSFKLVIALIFPVFYFLLFEPLQKAFVLKAFFTYFPLVFRYSTSINFLQYYYAIFSKIKKSDCKKTKLQKQKQ